MQLSDPKSLSTAHTARTYPVTASDLARATESAIQRLPRWTLARASEEEVQAVRRTRFLGFADEVTVHLMQSRTGANINTRARFVSASRVGVWDLGQNRRNLDELLLAIDRELTANN
jgi:uncharacterized protein (DUF1499 family)